VNCASSCPWLIHVLLMFHRANTARATLTHRHRELCGTIANELQIRCYSASREHKTVEAKLNREAIHTLIARPAQSLILFSE
jgi:hypothetical protein